LAFFAVVTAKVVTVDEDDKTGAKIN